MSAKNICSIRHWLIVYVKVMVELQKFIADLEEPLEEFPQDHFQLLARHIHESFVSSFRHFLQHSH